MGDVTIHFRGMHLFVFDGDPRAGTAAVTVYVPPGTPHRHRWVVMLDTSTREPGASWFGDLALTTPGGVDWLCVMPAGPVGLTVGNAGLPVGDIGGAGLVAEHGVGLGDAAGSAQVNAELALVPTRLTLTGGTCTVEPPLAPSLRKQWLVGDRMQCLSDHVVWRAETTAAAALTIGAQRYPFGETSARIHCVNYPDHLVAGVPGQLLHIQSLYRYVDATRSALPRITVDDCQHWPPVGGGGFPVECPYAWALE